MPSHDRTLTGVPVEKFWAAIDELIATSKVVIDRPKGSRHPQFEQAIYPVDYGYLEGTLAGDGDGIDIWIGSGHPAVLTGIVCTVDQAKRDAELKLLAGCTHAEEVAILTFLNTGNMAAVLLSPPAGHQRSGTRRQ